MDIISIVLSTWLVFGFFPVGNVPIPKDEGIYKLLPVYSHEVIWENNADKWNQLTRIALSEPNNYGVYSSSDGPIGSEDNTDAILSERVSNEDGNKYFSDPQSLYSIFFPMEKYIPITGSYERLLRLIPKGSKVAIRGYASPDGKNPEQQYGLAVARASYIRNVLKEKLITVEYEDARVCALSENPASCWRVDVKVWEE